MNLWSSSGSMLAYLGLGSNLGHRVEALLRAMILLEENAGSIRRISRIYETAPLYVEEQPSFLNIVLELETSLAPKELLHAAKRIESQLGRKTRARFHEREIDIDMVAMTDSSGNIITYHDEELTLPHPLASERRFVLEPLAELAPHLQITDCMTVAKALEQVAVQSQDVRIFSSVEKAT
ncbi:MAG TPA: 2-amino-4-hydroxy-6-hydroxymethyldihydropteridine diphosphokinase [Fimbriimonadales bacterium]|nr:2-amino-4-hydroxy-6-hydroxymethyldihydropteridine diphosphokinase [Fimbriimonadales bacterium]